MRVKGLPRKVFVVKIKITINIQFYSHNFYAFKLLAATNFPTFTTNIFIVVKLLSLSGVFKHSTMWVCL